MRASSVASRIPVPVSVMPARSLPLAAVPPSSARTEPHPTERAGCFDEDRFDGVANMAATEMVSGPRGSGGACPEGRQSTGRQQRGLREAAVGGSSPNASAAKGSGRKCKIVANGAPASAFAQEPGAGDVCSGPARHTDAESPDLGSRCSTPHSSTPFQASRDLGVGGHRTCGTPVHHRIHSVDPTASPGLDRAFGGEPPASGSPTAIGLLHRLRTIASGSPRSVAAQEQGGEEVSGVPARHTARASPAGSPEMGSRCSTPRSITPLKRNRGLGVGGTRTCGTPVHHRIHSVDPTASPRVGRPSGGEPPPSTSDRFRLVERTPGRTLATPARRVLPNGSTKGPTATTPTAKRHADEARTEQRLHCLPPDLLPGLRAELREVVQFELRDEIREELHRDFRAQLDEAVQEWKDRDQRVSLLVDKLQEQLTSHDATLDEVAGEVLALTEQGSEHASALDAIAANASLLQDYVDQRLLAMATTKQGPFGAISGAPPPPVGRSLEDTPGGFSASSPSCLSPGTPQSCSGLTAVRRRLLDIRQSLATESAEAAGGELLDQALHLDIPPPEQVAEELAETERFVEELLTIVRPEIVGELRGSFEVERESMFEEIRDRMRADIAAIVRQECDFDFVSQIAALEDKAKSMGSSAGAAAGAAAAAAAVHKAWNGHRGELVAVVSAELQSALANGSLPSPDKLGLAQQASPQAALWDAAEPCPEQACCGDVAQEEERWSELPRARLQHLEERVEALMLASQRAIAADAIEPLILDVRNGLKYAETTTDQISIITEQLSRLHESVSDIESRPRADAPLTELGRRLERIETASSDARFQELEERIESLAHAPYTRAAATNLEFQVLDLQERMSGLERTSDQVSDISDQLSMLRLMVGCVERQQREDLASREAAGRRLEQLDGAAQDARWKKLPERPARPTSATGLQG